MRKPLFTSAVSGGGSLVIDGKSADSRLLKKATQDREFYVNRALPAKSGHANVTIDCRFENILPYLVQLKKLDIIDSLIDSFGETKVNHLNLLILHNQEAAALYNSQF